MKQIRVAAGYGNVPIYGKLLNQGQFLTLSDLQYADLPSFVKQQINVVRTAADPEQQARPSGQDSFSDQWFNSELIQQGVPIVLTWNGTSYQPAKLRSRVDRPKTFIGPNDPKDIPGVVLAVRDQWINY